MSKKSRKVLKTYFQTGDQPTESEFVNWFDSSLILSGSNGITGSLIISGSTNDNADGSIPMLYVMGDITSSGNISASGTIYANNFQSTGGDVAGISFTDDFFLDGDLTASGDISASGDLSITGKSFFEGSITASNNISASGDIINTGNILCEGTSITIQNSADPILRVKDTTNNFFVDLQHTNLTSKLKFDHHLDQDLYLISKTDNKHMVLDGGTGNVGIGINNPPEKLTVEGNISSSGDFTINNITASGIISASGDIVTDGILYTDQIRRNTDFPFHNRIILGSNQMEFRAGSSTNSMLKLAGVFGAVFNEDGSNLADFRIEGDSDPYLFFTDAGNNSITLGSTATTHVTASGNISASLASTGSFGRVESTTFSATTITATHGEFTTINTTEITSSIVTASVIYSSGSNIFGDESTDSHTFNGSITASGNISASGTITAEYVDLTGLNGMKIGKVGSAPAIGFSLDASNYALAAPSGYTTINAGSGDFINFKISNTEKMRMNSAGQFGIGTSFPGEKLEVIGNISASGNILAPTGTGSFAVVRATADISASGDIIGVTGSFDYVKTSKLQVGAAGGTDILSIDGGDLQLENGKQITFADIGDGNTGRVRIVGSESTDTISMHVDNGSSKNLTLTTTGVGIGTTSPGEKLEVVGNISSSGTITALNFTGPLLGTSSWADNAITASFITTAQTASYVTTAQTASYVATASWADNAVNQTGTNTGDITVTGTPDYITISNQVITRNQIDLAADVTGILPSANLDADTAHIGTNDTFTGDKTFSGALTASAGLKVVGNISSSGDIYSTNHESIYQASINCLAGSTAFWYGPNKVGLNLNTWNFNYGNNTGVLTLAQEHAHAGIIVPYKCKLVGFRAVGSPLAGSSTIELALYHEPAASATFNDTTGAADDALIVSVAAATSTSTDTAENPMLWSKLDATTELIAGDMLYPRIKVSNVAGCNLTFTVLVQRIK